MTFSAMIRVAPLAAASLLVASCSSETAPPEVQDEDLDARGEVLGGTISDDMLPLDTVTSQSPPRASGESTATSEGEQPVEPVEQEAEAAPEPPAPPVLEAPAEPEEPEEPEEPPSDG